MSYQEVRKWKGKKKNEAQNVKIIIYALCSYYKRVSARRLPTYTGWKMETDVVDVSRTQ